MGATTSSPLPPSALPTPPNSSPIKLIDEASVVERILYPSLESHCEFNHEAACVEDDHVPIKDEPMSDDIIPSIEKDEQEEEWAQWRAEHAGSGVVRFFLGYEDGSPYGDHEEEAENLDDSNLHDSNLDNSYDANECFADLDVDDKRQQEEQLKAAEQAGEEEGFDLAAFLDDQRRRGWRMVQKDGWSEDTVEAYMLIERRDHETLFPDSWRSQFPQFPADLFCDRHRTDTGLLGPLTPSRDTTMKWAITKFLEMAPRVRDNSRPDGHTFYKRRPEGLVEEHVKQYAKMVYKDAGLERDVRKRHIPTLFTFASAMYGTEPHVLEAKIRRKLRRRASRVLSLLRITKNTPISAIEAAKSAQSPTLFRHNGEYYLYEPPTLYGIVTAQTVSALVAYEPLGDSGCIRQMAFFHLSKDAFDVWNCIALALMVIWCRNHMLNMQDILPEQIGDEMDTAVDEDL